MIIYFYNSIKIKKRAGFAGFYPKKAQTGGVN